MDRATSEDVPVLIVAAAWWACRRRCSCGSTASACWPSSGTRGRPSTPGGPLPPAHGGDPALGRSRGHRRRTSKSSTAGWRINNVKSLAGREIANYFPNLNAGVDEFSPTVRLFVNQDALEPIIRARAGELGARLRYGTECTTLEQDADGVTAVIRDLASGAESTVRARYVVAADGNRSPVREQLGIGMSGHGLLSHSITIYFRSLTDLGPLLKDRNQGVHYVTTRCCAGSSGSTAAATRAFSWSTWSEIPPARRSWRPSRMPRGPG